MAFSIGEGSEDFYDGKDRGNGKAFLAGASLHLCIWLLVVSFDTGRFNFLCDEGSCYFLLALDFPVVFLDPIGGRVGVSVSSLILGSLWWGLIFVLIRKLLKLIQVKN